jgi:FkbM family methyltransferase
VLDLVQPFAAWGQLVGFRAEPFQSRAPCRNLELNPELARRIEVLPVAVAARDGEMDFVLSLDIESGMSSGSFLELAKPPRESGDYANFIRRPVPTVSLDSFQLKHDPPLVVKTDVEGGEQLVLQGAQEFLSRSQAHDSAGGSQHSVDVLRTIDADRIWLPVEID